MEKTEGELALERRRSVAALSTLETQNISYANTTEAVATKKGIVKHGLLIVDALFVLHFLVPTKNPKDQPADQLRNAPADF